MEEEGNLNMEDLSECCFPGEGRAAVKDLGERSPSGNGRAVFDDWETHIPGVMADSACLPSSLVGRLDKKALGRHVSKWPGSLSR